MGFFLNLLLLSVANLKQFWGKFWVSFTVSSAPPFQVRTVPLERRMREELALRRPIRSKVLVMILRVRGRTERQGSSYGLPASHRSLSWWVWVQMSTVSAGVRSSWGCLSPFGAPSHRERRVAGWVLFHEISRKLEIERGASGLLSPLTFLLVPSFSYISYPHFWGGPAATQEVCCSRRLPASNAHTRLHLPREPLAFFFFF